MHVDVVSHQSSVSLTKTSPLLASHEAMTIVTPEKGATSESGASASATTSITSALTIRSVKPRNQNLRRKSGSAASGRCCAS